MVRKKKNNTNSRYTKVIGYRSGKRLQNDYLRRFMLSNPDISPTAWRRPVKLTPKQRGLEAHENKVSVSCSITERNMIIINNQGYKPRKTRLHVMFRRIERNQRDLFSDGMTCRKRRQMYKDLHKIKTVKRAA